jgi:hypothetical protein
MHWEGSRLHEPQGPTSVIDLSPVTSLGVQFSSDYLLSDYLLDNFSGSAHCSRVRQSTHLTRVIRRKPILSEQALPVYLAVDEFLSRRAIVDTEGDSHADSAHN